jgi:hypothetical protein
MSVTWIPLARCPARAATHGSRGHRGPVRVHGVLDLLRHPSAAAGRLRASYQSSAQARAAAGSAAVSAAAAAALH